MIIPVLLAGGSGTRLWPTSRKSYPKQFSKIFGNNTLFQDSLYRVNSSTNLKFDNPIVITNNDYRFLVEDQIKKIRKDKVSILIEPDSKSTAPSILAAVLYAYKKNSNADILVTPTDQLISSTNHFHNAILNSLFYLNDSKIVTLGVKPTLPETGYGYLELEKKFDGKPLKVNKFIEKPNLELANKMLSSDNYLWNTGVLVFKAVDLINIFKKYSSNTFNNVNWAVEEGNSDLNFFRLNEKHWSKCQKNSIDYEIMEKIDTIISVPLLSNWSDVGSWSSIWENKNSNESGVVTSKNVTEVNCQNSLFISEDENLHLVALGIKETIAIAMKDAVLIADKNLDQNVGDVVKILRDKKIEQAEKFPKTHRPWGFFEILVSGKDYQVKKIHVNSKASLSLQSHSYRSEHWVVVKGVATVTLEKNKRILKESESIFIPIGKIHRLQNNTDSTLIIIEIQTGSYLGEDDIIRIDDIYSR